MQDECLIVVTKSKLSSYFPPRLQETSVFSQVSELSPQVVVPEQSAQNASSAAADVASSAAANVASSAADLVTSYPWYLSQSTIVSLGCLTGALMAIILHRISNEDDGGTSSGSNSGSGGLGAIPKVKKVISTIADVVINEGEAANVMINDGNVQGSGYSTAESMPFLEDIPEGDEENITSTTDSTESNTPVDASTNTESSVYVEASTNTESTVSVEASTNTFLKVLFLMKP